MSSYILLTERCSITLVLAQGKEEKMMNLRNDEREKFETIEELIPRYRESC